MDDERIEINHQLMKNLFSRLKSTSFFNLLLALYVAIYFYIEKGLLLNTVTWFSAMTVVVVFRYVISWVAESQLKKERSNRYHYLLSIILFFTGLLWGYSYAFFSPDVSSFLSMIVLLIIASVSVASTVSMVASRYCFYGFISPVILSILGKGLMIASPQSYSIVFLMLIYTLFLKIVYNCNHDMLIENICLTLKQNDLITRLNYFSTTDELTKIANRRYFNDRLDNDWEKACRSQMPISLIIVDIDFFKTINDNYGHLMGDKHLQKIAQIISSNVTRSIDLVSRYGGDEFAIVLYDTDSAGAIKVAKKISLALKNANIINEYSSVSNRVTISIGISSIIPSIKEKVNVLILMADKALYKVKAKGRNGIECLCEEPPFN